MQYTQNNIIVTDSNGKLLRQTLINGISYQYGTDISTIDNHGLVEYVAPTPAPTATEPAVPFEVTMRQARLMLARAGLLADINNAIASMGEEAQITWEYATHVQRDSPLIEMVREDKGLTIEQIDALFIEASEL
jgi:hypothetical protein